MPAFSAAIGRKSVAEKFAVIERQPGDDACQRPLDHIGGVEPAAEADFQQHNVGRMAREQKKAGGGLHLEDGDRRVAVLCLAFGERRAEFGVADQPAAAIVAETKPLVDADKIGRGIDMHALARRLEDRAHEGDGRAFAVGAGDVDDRRQAPLRMIERGEKPLDAIERKIDALGMQRQEPRQHGVERRGLGLPIAHVTAGSGAGNARCSGALAGDLVNSRHNFAMVPRNSWRCTTMSTMP